MTKFFLMSVVSIHQAKTHLSRLIQRALEGEDIVIAKRDEPLVRLQVIRETPPARRFGGLRDVVVAMGEGFNEELPDFLDYAPKLEKETETKDLRGE
ncbi:MAG: type II toxin-antitoxin system prevent-host-death family antitoxin [Verrucomicrobiota bacterium]